MSTTQTEKIQVKEIKIKRAEGLTKLCGIEHTFNNWEDSRCWLLSQSSTFPAENMGYDKVDFWVTFSDGYEYAGRLDCKQITCDNNDLNVKDHIKTFMQFYTGEFQPYWMKPEQYEQALQGVNKEEYKEFLNKYDV